MADRRPTRGVNSEGCAACRWFLPGEYSKRAASGNSGGPSEGLFAATGVSEFAMTAIEADSRLLLLGILAEIEQFAEVPDDAFDAADRFVVGMCGSGCRSRPPCGSASRCRRPDECRSRGPLEAWPAGARRRGDQLAQPGSQALGKVTNGEGSSRGPDRLPSKNSPTDVSAK